MSLSSAAIENLDDFRFDTPVVTERTPFSCGACQRQTHRRNDERDQDWV